MKFLRIIYLGVIYFADATSKCRLIFERDLLISSVCSLCCCIYSSSSDCYGSFHKYVRITVVTETRFQHCGFKFDLAIDLVISTHIVVDFNAVLCSDLGWLINCVVNQIYEFLILHSLYI